MNRCRSEFAAIVLVDRGVESGDSSLRGTALSVMTLAAMEPPCGVLD